MSHELMIFPHTLNSPEMKNLQLQNIVLEPATTFQNKIQK